jgi:glycosyltransferase involved in cell wall biosynthesis
MSTEKHRWNIAFVTPMDPQDRRAWSGILFHTSQALQKYCGVIASIAAAESPDLFKRSLYKRLRLFVKKYAAYNPFFSIGRKYFVCNYRIATAKKFAKKVPAWLATTPFDVIIAPASTTEIAFIETDIPIVLIEDATFASLHNYYPQYSALPKKAVREMNFLSEKAIKKARLLIYASSWAAQSAIKEYHAEPEKVHVVPMGANLENPPSKEIIQQKQRSDQCRLLFIGFDWKRKGGEIAFETLLALEEQGIQAELTVCGCVPPGKYRHKRMKVIPYLDKNNLEQYRQLEQLYLKSDFLLLPTRNECFGLVFCEANAFGLPIITTHTGGVPEVVKDGQNGFVLPVSARGSAYAEIIARLYQDNQRYAELVVSSRAAFDDRLNWDAWGIATSQLITEMLENINR